MPLGLAPLPVVFPGLVVELVGPPELLPLAPAALPAPAPPPAPPAPPPPPPPPWANTAVLSNKADTSARGKSLVRNISDLPSCHGALHTKAPAQEAFRTFSNAQRKVAEPCCPLMLGRLLN